MILHKLTRAKIDEFFHSDSGEAMMKLAGKEYEKAMNKVHDEFMERFRDCLVDEYSLFYQELVEESVTREVRALIKGDKDALSRYSLAPNNWGIPSDVHRCRRLIVENNKDIITSTYIEGLEEQLERALELNESYRNRF